MKRRAIRRRWEDSTQWSTSHLSPASYTKEITRRDSVVIDGASGHQHRRDLNAGGRRKHEAEQSKGPGRHSLRVITLLGSDVEEEAGTGREQVADEDDSGARLRLVEEGGETHGIGGEAEGDAT